MNHLQEEKIKNLEDSAVAIVMLRDVNYFLNVKKNKELPVSLLAKIERFFNDMV